VAHERSSLDEISFGENDLAKIQTFFSSKINLKIREESCLFE